MTNEELNTALYKKVFAEQEKYREWLLSQPPEEILNHTYEYTVREDILMSLEYNSLPTAQVRALLKSPSPLAGCVCGVGGPGDKLYGGNLADCHRPGQSGSAEVPEHTNAAIRTKSGWIAQSDFLHSRCKRQRRRFYMSRTYLRGEIYYADLDPVVGSEQMGIRPVLILQNNVGNHFARTVIVAPITSRIHTKSKIPTHSNIGMIGRMKYPSVVMLEQLRTLDKRRIGYYIGKLPEEKMQDVTRALCVSLAIRQNTAKGM